MNAVTPRKRMWIWPAAALSLAVVLLVLFHRCVPLNMDEFVSYQTLALFLQPLSAVQSAAFPNFHLRVLDRFTLPLLTYDYIGSLSCWLYAPYHFICASPTMARAAGLVAMGFQALIIAKIFCVRWSVVYCCLLLLVPYAFVHIVDTGPVAFQVSSVLLIGYLLNRWVLSNHWRHRVAMMGVGGLLVALGCWAKPTYFFVSAGVAVLCISAFLTSILGRRRPQIFSRILESSIFVVCAGIPTLILYHATRPNGGPYLPVVGTNLLTSQVVSGGLWDRFRDNVFHFVVNPVDALAPCFFNLPTTRAWAIASSSIGIVLMIALLCRRIPVRHRVEIAVNLVMFAVALVLVATNVYAKSMHHAVLAFPFLVMAVARGCQRPRGRTWVVASLALLVGSQATIYLAIPRMYRALRDQGSDRAFVADTHEGLKGYSHTSVIACAEWGIYFVETLYGSRDEAAIALFPYDQEPKLEKAAVTAQKLNRDLVVVCLRGNNRVESRMRQDCPNAVETPLPGQNNPWRAWRVPPADLPRLINSQAPRSGD